MTPLPADVIHLLKRVGRVQSWTQALRWGSAATLAVAVAALLWTIVGMIVSVTVVPLIPLAAGVAMALLLTLARGILPSGKMAVLARLADARLATRERLSTAVDLVEGQIHPTALTPRVMADAAQAARSAAVDGLRPRLPRQARWAGALLLSALLAAWIVPGVTLPATPARQTAQRIRQEGRRLEEAGRRLEEQARTTRAPQARRAAPEVQRLGRDLQQQRLDRAAAQARIAELQRQLESARRRIGERIGEALSPQTRAQPPETFFRQPGELDRSIRQLRELAARLADMPVSEGERRDLLQQLSDMAQTGEGRIPAPARRQVEEARRQAQAGNTAGAGEALQEALQELEALNALVSDEQALRMTERELEQSSDRIARGAGGRGRGEQDPQADPQEGQTAPGAERPQQDEAGAAPPEGPHQGSTPGRGKSQAKLGAPSPRLEARGDRSRVRGQEAPGQVQTSEILGPGRRDRARTTIQPVAPTAARQADAHLARQRIPADLRALVRRYFEILAGQR